MSVLCFISLESNFPPQTFFSPRNVADRIREALDVLHREVCLHLLAPC